MLSEKGAFHFLNVRRDFSADKRNIHFILIKWGSQSINKAEKQKIYISKERKPEIDSFLFMLKIPFRISPIFS